MKKTMLRNLQKAPLPPTSGGFRREAKAGAPKRERVLCLSEPPTCGGQGGLLASYLLAALLLLFSPSAHADTPTLRQAAANHYLIGTAVSPRQLSDDATSTLIATQFDAITAENAFKPDSLERERGVFTYTDADRIADFAAAHHEFLIGHCLCWHQQSPTWLYVDADGKPLPREQALANLHDFIHSVVTHFKGKVRGWDVVNEAIADGPGDLRDTPARRAIGDDFIQKAFEFAHEADPDAELYYNDYGIESPGKREKAVRLIHDLKAHGVRIDAVGIQGHFSLGWPPLSTVEDAIKAFAAEGVRVSFTELDVDVLPRQSQSAEIGTRENAANPYPTACPPDVLKAQADRYAALFDVFNRHPGVVERVTLWGVDDGQSWLNNFPVHGRTNYPLLFDRQLKPKPAFDAVVSTLTGKPVATASVPQTAPVSAVSARASGASAGLTADQDRQLMMDQLHIASLRSGVDGFNMKAANAVNYDESKADTHLKLPDPLVMNDGKPVTSARMWWRDRRPQIVEYFDREIYGRVPKHTPKVNWEVVKTTEETVGDIPVTVKQLVGHVDNSSYPAVSVDIALTLTTPAHSDKPVPVMMQFGFNFGRRPAVAGAANRPAPPAGAFPASNGPTWQQQALAKGWGYAILVPTTVQADNGAGLSQGIIGLCNKGMPRKPDDWGALRAWAWGASRALDYFESDKAVDAKKVAIEGHSRYGKAALVTLAYDPRFAIAYVSSSGEAGAKLWRRNFGETEGNIAAGGEYHWMAGNFLKYDGPLTVADLPIDSHELIALCAPRPVFIGAGVADKGDGWVDAKGMFLAEVAAGPVYDLLGKKDLGATELPPVETTLIEGDLGFRQQNGGHTDVPNWPTFLTFAEREFGLAPVKTADVK